MTDNSYTNEYHDGQTMSPALEILLAQYTGNAESMYFVTPAITVSLESELHILHDLIQYLHAYRITAHVLMPVVKSGGSRSATVRMSGLVLMVDIQGMAPEALAFVRTKCRWTMRQMARGKGPCEDHRGWQQLLADTKGHFAEGSVESEVQTFTRNIRMDFLTGKSLTNGIIHYRVGRNGVLESAEVDFREEPTRLKFTEAVIPEPGLTVPAG